MTSQSQDQPEDTQSSAYALNYEGAMTSQNIAGRSVQEHASFFLPLLKPGMSLLDCGCGPGSITLGLAKSVAPGEVTGVDIGESQIEAARARAIEEGITNARFETANVYELPFPDHTFDAVFSNAVLMHLTKPIDAVREMYRVLKRGGIAGIRDPWRNFVLLPQNDIIDAFWDLRNRVTLHRGREYGFEPVPREILRKAGFTNTVGGASSISHGTIERTRQIANAIESIQEDIKEVAIQMGWTNEETVEKTRAALKEWAEHPDAMAAYTWIDGIGFKD